MSRVIQECTYTALALPHDIVGTRRRSAEPELDILLYTDIGMDPTVFVAFSHLGPVSVYYHRR